MSVRKHIRWLYGQMPELVRKELLSEKQAAAIEEYYGPAPDGGGRRAAVVAFSIIGSLLIGVGVISLLAHNWSQLTRAARTFIALAPLLAVQGFGVNCMIKRKGQAAMEGVSALICLLFANAVAIVGQTYNIGGDLGGFLMTCSICIIPLTFIMDAVVPACLYLAAITSWLGYEKYHDGRENIYWLLLVPALVRYLGMAARERYAGRTVFLGWIMALSVSVAVGFVQDYSIGGSWIVVFASLFSVMYLAAARWFSDAESGWASPFSVVGAVGSVVMSFILTNEFAWKSVTSRWGYAYWYNYREFSLVDIVLMLGMVAASVLFVVPFIRERKWQHSLTGGLGLLSAAAFVLVQSSGLEWCGMVIFNIYLLVLSITRISAGVRRERMGELNAGMLIMGALVMLRFIDADVGFLAKGIVFILLGAAFLAVNVVFLKRQKEVSK